jgi:hypothetical protein
MMHFYAAPLTAGNWKDPDQKMTEVPEIARRIWERLGSLCSIRCSAGCAHLFLHVCIRHFYHFPKVLNLCHHGQCWQNTRSRQKIVVNARVSRKSCGIREYGEPGFYAICETLSIYQHNRVLSRVTRLPLRPRHPKLTRHVKLHDSLTR